MNTPSPLASIWFFCGSNTLGPGPLQEVAANARHRGALYASAHRCRCPSFEKRWSPRPEEIRHICLEANADPNCAGIILWMHTFSPSKMWIGGLSVLKKPFCHLHTQFNRDLPWAEIDMDFMNLNQAAHGDREAGFIHSRMRLDRKVVVGHWSDPEVADRIGVWMRVAHAWHDLQGAPFARFGDNMRNVAVTEGDKVAPSCVSGSASTATAWAIWSTHVNGAGDSDIAALVAEYDRPIHVVPELRNGGDRHESLRYGARIELGLRRFLDEGGLGFTTTFEDLHGLRQLPGLAVQRLMADGYGFGGEGDWKTAALVRAMKVMAHGLPGGTRFMEDYTYHLDPGNQLSAGRAHAGSLPHALPRASPRWRSTRWALAARKTQCAWSLMRVPVRPSTSRW